MARARLRLCVLQHITKSDKTCGITISIVARFQGRVNVNQSVRQSFDIHELFEFMSQIDKQLWPEKKTVTRVTNTTRENLKLFTPMKLQKFLKTKFFADASPGLIVELQTHYTSKIVGKFLFAIAELRPKNPTRGHNSI